MPIKKLPALQTPNYVLQQSYKGNILPNATMCRWVRQNGVVSITNICSEWLGTFVLKPNCFDTFNFIFCNIFISYMDSAGTLLRLCCYLASLWRPLKEMFWRGSRLCKTLVYTCVTLFLQIEFRAATPSHIVEAGKSKVKSDIQVYANYFSCHVHCQCKDVMLFSLWIKAHVANEKGVTWFI